MDVVVAGKKCKRYDNTQTAGTAAQTLIQSWSTTTDDMPAPWRQTGGGGGSEFGKPKWLAALKAGFKTPENPPRFAIWQLALADHVVRTWRITSAARGHIECPTQAERLVKPTNPRAVGASHVPGVRWTGRAGGDTESGVRKWMAKLTDKLKGANPAPVIISAADAQEAGGVPTRIELRITDYETATGPSGSA